MGREMPPREWKTGLFDCAADPDGNNRCCQTFWCPGYAFGRMVEHEHAPEDIPCHKHCLGGFLCFHFTGPFAVCMSNKAIREREGIEGNWFTDLATSICCLGCAQCRQAREIDLKHHEEKAK